jgi:aryl-alcohol dehydrogenase-like predicted oxidoreductase
MVEILAVFKSEGARGFDAVLNRARSAEDTKFAVPYGNFYVGLYLDACHGDRAAALPFFEQATAAPPDDYMGKMFALHYRLAKHGQIEIVPRVGLGESEGYTHSSIILGGWQLSAGHHDGFKKDVALASMAEHHREGVSTLDCGDIYTGVEALIGEHVDRVRATGTPNPVQIHTKLVPDLSRLTTVDDRYCQAVLLRSKNRLGLLGPLDLVQFHWWDWAVGDHVEAYSRLCKAREDGGLVRNVGITNYDAEHTKQLLDAGLPVASNQVQYSLVDRRVEGALAPLCVGADVQLLCYGTLAGGFLTDTWVGRAEPSVKELENRSLVKYKLMVDEFGGWAVFQALLQLLRGIADRQCAACTLADIAIAWVLSRPAVGGVILGARNARHLPSTIRAARITLTPVELASVEAFLSDHTTPPVGPFFGLERDRDGPHGRIMRYELNRVHTAVHLDELEARVAAHIACGARRWADRTDRATFAQQLVAEAKTFEVEGSATEEHAGRLKLLLERLIDFQSGQ